MLDSLEAVYSELPKIECRRKCIDSCGPLIVPRVEHDQVVKTGFHIPVADISKVPLNETWARHGKENLVGWNTQGNFICVNLYPFSGKCRVYAVRPLVCRVWGLMKRMQCPFGCIPERWMSEEEVQGLFDRVMQIQKRGV